MRLPSFLQRKRAVTVPQHTPKNEYYETVSAHLGIFQVVLYLSLLAFVVLSFAKNTNLITYRNFYYFFKDLDASAEGVDVMHSDAVTYPTAQSQSFVLYRGGLAVAGNNSVTVFTPTGRQTVSQTVSYQNPVAQGSGKYLLVYELGGTQYSLYNSYTQLYAGKTDAPINGAAVSKSGMYALLTSSKEYTSVVSLYSSNFSLINRYNKNGYVMDIAINESGSRLALLTVGGKNAGFQSTVELYAPGEGEARSRTEWNNFSGLRCGFTDANTLALVSSSQILFLNGEGERLAEHDFEGMTPTSLDLGTGGVALSLQPASISEKNHIIMFDKTGKVLYNKGVEQKVEQISRCEGAVYFKSANGVHRIDMKAFSLSSVECHTEQRGILAVGEDEVLLCSPQKAEYLRFSPQS